MKFSRVFVFVIVVLAALCAVHAAPSPRWNPFKKLEKVGRNIRNGLIKAGPAVQVVGQAATILRPQGRKSFFIHQEKVGRNIRNGLIKAGPAVQVVGQAATILRPQG